MSQMASQNNTTALESDDQFSIRSLQAQAGGWVCWLLAGLFSIVSNFLAVLTIAKSKPLHTKYFCTLASLTAGGFVCGLAYTYQGGKKSYLLLTGLPETGTQLNCLIGFVPMMWSTGLSDCLTLGLNIDRFLALAWPITYRQRLSKVYVITLNAACWLAPTIFWAFSFNLKDPTQVIPICLGATAVDKWFSLLFTNIRWVSAVPNLTLVSATLIILKKRFDRTKALAAKERRAAREALELGMVKAMCAVLVMYIVLKLGTYAAFAVAIAALTGVLQGQVIAYVGSLPGVYAGSHFFLYLIMSRDFRKGFRRLFTKPKITPVVTISTRHI